MFMRQFAIIIALGCAATARRAGATHKHSDLLPRQEECIDPGWIPVCPGILPCIPPEGTCCTGEYYHLPGETCPDGETEVPRIDQTGVPSSITVAPTATPTPLPPVGDYTWYTFTLFYTYYSYYYYSFEATYTLTSLYISTETLVSLTATDEAAASLALETLTETMIVPTQTATPTIDVPPDATDSSSASKTPTIATSTRTPTRTPTSSGNVTLPTISPTPSAAFTGAAAGLGATRSSLFGNSFTYVLIAMLAAPGALMFLL